MELSEQQSVVKDRSAALQQLETGLAAARKEFDRRLDLQQQDSKMHATQLEQQLTALRKQQQTQATATTTLQFQTVELDHPSERDHEWKKLIVSSQKKDEYIADLEKHLLFYKSKAKQMQTQLQQLIRDTAKCNQQGDDDGDEDNADGDDGDRDEDHPRRARKDAAHQFEVRIRQLEEANDALTKDLATAKVRLCMSGVC